MAGQHGAAGVCQWLPLRLARSAGTGSRSSARCQAVATGRPAAEGPETGSEVEPPQPPEPSSPRAGHWPAPPHSLPLNRGLGAFASHCDAVRAQHSSLKEGPPSKDSRSRSEVEWHRLNENGTSEVASGGQLVPAALTHDDGRANAADARERGSRRTQYLKHFRAC
jgi:hypothetical protein